MKIIVKTENETKEFENKIFGNGESVIQGLYDFIRKVVINTITVVTTEKDHPSDILIALTQLSEMDYSRQYTKPALNVDFIPYLRSDKDGFGNKQFDSLLSSFRAVNTPFPHHKFFENDSRALQLAMMIKYNPEIFTYVFPDESAWKRFSASEHTLVGKDIKYIVFDKARSYDGITQNIKMKSEKITDWAIMIDDICSYGNSFIGLEEQLKKQHGFKKVQLYTYFKENRKVGNKLIDEQDYTKLIYGREDK